MGGHTPGRSHLEMAAVLVYRESTAGAGTITAVWVGGGASGTRAEVLHPLNPSDRVHTNPRRPLRHRPDRQVADPKGAR